MANVVSLPGVLRADLIDAADPKNVLAAAMELPLKDVIVVGRNINGDLEVFASQPDADQSIGLLMRGVNFLANSEQIDEPDEA